MKELFTESVFFGVLISLGSYFLGVWLKEKTKWSLMNPLLVFIIMVIAILLCTGVSYDSYMKGANNLSCSAFISASGAVEEKL